jgi:hypothetical protein
MFEEDKKKITETRKNQKNVKKKTTNIMIFNKQ